MAAKCPVTRKEFEQHAPKQNVTLVGEDLTLDPRTFSTQSLGWNYSGKAHITIDGKKVPVTVGLNITVIGSKELAEEPALAS